MNDNAIDTYECNTCKGTGSKYDPTNADKLATGGMGTGSCWNCHGTGVVQRMAYFGPPDKFDVRYGRKLN